MASIISVDSTSSARQSHGRGGAGNIRSASSQKTGTFSSSTPPPAYDDDVPVAASTLNTPHIKQAIYTTGRGGSGNMTVNDPLHPERAREAQDVEAPPGLVGGIERGSDSEGVRFGRGGAANITKSQHSTTDNWQGPNRENGKSDYRGWADRGKDILLGRGRK
ncbi:MAG: hypothetical protein M1825_000135 [Sarcosagium campestre]|nr:MAG: hypothetical protein M1825_000135 [Sarcosagium campestre]